MSMPGDEEFRELFAQESSQRLVHLQQDLLELETRGASDALVSSIFRDAHTLKGSAAVLAFVDVARVAQAMEDILEQVRNHTRPISAHLVDVMFATIDNLSDLSGAALAGADSSLAADRAVQRLLDIDIDLDERARPTPTPTPARAQRSISGEAPISALSTTADVGPRKGGEADAAGRSDALSTEDEAPRLRASTDTVMVPSDRLDGLVRLAGETATAQLRLGALVDERYGKDVPVADAFRDLSSVLRDLQERTMQVRMVPLSTITDALHRAVRDAARGLGKRVHWEARGVETELDRGILQQVSDPLIHLLRNAVDHGIELPAERLAAGKPEMGTVRVHAMQLGSEVVIAVSDDGHGIDLERVRTSAQARGLDVTGLDSDQLLQLVFRSGISTADRVTPLSGRGVGLDAVRTNIDAVRGRVEVHSDPGKGSEFRLIVPITLAVLPCVLVEAAQQRYAIPMHSVVSVDAVKSASIDHVGGQVVLRIDDGTARVFELAGVLEGRASSEPTDGYFVVLSVTTRRDAFVVDRLVGQRDVVVKSLGGVLPRLEVFAGASIEPDGSILLVLDAQGLVDRASRSAARPSPQRDATSELTAPADVRARILVVDDALTVRELERSILERAGYEVSVAVDGSEALGRLAEQPVDLVLTDVEMPVMNGFELTEAIRADERWSNLPVLILTSRANDEDRHRGLDAGADGYIVKSSFDEGSLLSAIVGVLGPAR
jgi:two-component system chemotaxis sensor kinase CheA